MDNLPFYTESADGFTPTETVGSFTHANEANSFDTVFTEACNNLKKNWQQDFTSGFLTKETLDNDVIIGSFKNDLLSGFMEDCENIKKTHGDLAGQAGMLYDQLSKEFDNKVQAFTEDVAAVGTLQPIKAIDFPVMVKAQVRESFKDVVNEEISPSLIVKKRIQHTYVYSRKDPTKRWEYPQAMFREDFKKMMEAGRGTKIKEDAVALPLFNYNIVEQLTDAAVAKNARLVFDIKIDKVEVADGTVITLDHPMSINLADGAWVGGVINQTYTNQTSETKTLQDVITGYMDWTTGLTSLNSANTTDGVTKVHFSGRLSNERNENTLRFTYAQEDKEWKIGEGVKVDAGYSLETLQEHKALLNWDLYQKTYDDLVRLIADMADSDGYDWLDQEYEKYKTSTLDPLEWNPMVIESKFNCDSTIKTVALQAEYIAKQLKFSIDRLLIDIADTSKLDNLNFVCYGNPRYISLLDPSVKWIFRSGSSVGGIKLDYSYGVMTSGDVRIFVVSSKKIDAKKHPGLRFIPFSTDKETITFKRYKFSTDIVTSKESAYKDPDSAAGGQTYVWGTQRYANVGLQEIQAGMKFENADFINLK